VIYQGSTYPTLSCLVIVHSGDPNSDPCSHTTGRHLQSLARKSASCNHQCCTDDRDDYCHPHANDRLTWKLSTTSQVPTNGLKQTAPASRPSNNVAMPHGAYSIHWLAEAWRYIGVCTCLVGKMIYKVYQVRTSQVYHLTLLAIWKPFTGTLTHASHGD
jgi:hypothetical protein